MRLPLRARLLLSSPAQAVAASDKLLGIFVGFANRFSVSLFIIFYHLNDDEAGQLIQVILILKGSLKKV